MGGGLIKLSVLSSLLLLSACASLGPQFTTHKINDKSKAKLYIYRVSKFVGSAGSPYVCINDQVVGEIPNGGYLDLELRSGISEVRLVTPANFPAKVNLKLKKSKTHFLRVDYSIFKEIGKNIRTSQAGFVGTGAITAGADQLFLGGNEEVREKVTYFDTKTQKELNNPGFMAVKSELGFKEIKETNIFQPKNYTNNPCSKK